MAIKYLNGKRFFQAFIAGSLEIIKNQDHLNKINVFPVADADTGTNLAITLQAISDETVESESLFKTCSSMLDAAMSGARGNSGIIFTQFINGIFQEITGKHELSAKNFGIVLKNSVAHVYKSLKNPVEGTILTVFKDWAASFQKLSTKTENFITIITDSLKTAHVSLKSTSKQLAVLANKNLVDSGAQALVYFLEGIKSFILTGKIRKQTLESLPIIKEEIHTEKGEGNFPFRYCTESLIEAENLDTVQVEQDIEQFGDSIIVAATSSKAKIHIHTNNPADFFMKVKNFGDIKKIKVDDMSKQYNLCHRKQAKIALVTDSTCDIPENLMDEYNISFVPVNLNIDNNLFLDRLTINPEQFYKLMDQAQNYPTTSQPTQESFRVLYQYLLTHYEHVISVHLSQKLSGTYETARRAAKIIDENRIHVLDSKTLSGSLGLIVYRLAMMIHGGENLDQIMSKFSELQKMTQIFVQVKTLKYFIKGGRVSPLKGMIAKITNFKPIISVDDAGNSCAIGKFLREKSARKALYKLVDKFIQTNKIWNYIVIHAENEQAAKDVADEMTKRYVKKPAYFYNVAPVIALNAGIGVVAVAIMLE